MVVFEVYHMIFLLWNNNGIKEQGGNCHVKKENEKQRIITTELVHCYEAQLQEHEKSVATIQR